MSLTDSVSSTIREWIAAWPAEPDQSMLNRVLRYLAQWRSIMLARSLVSHHGTRVQSGLFEGMVYMAASTEGALMPRLLGTYEAELHPFLRDIIDRGVECVVDIGCAEGYYAVGLARLLPEATIYAHDIDSAARAACTELAKRNDVQQRVVTGGEFRPENFQAFAGRRTLVIVDIEGAEIELLRPDAAPSLAEMVMIVETHDVYRPGALETIRNRLAPTHDIVQVNSGPKRFAAPPWLAELSELDQLIATWEWRLKPTPWLVMSPKFTQP